VPDKAHPDIPRRTRGDRQPRGAAAIVFLAAAAAVLWGGSALAQAPRLVCEAPEFRFGQADSTRTIEHTFVLRNLGDADLAIRAIRPDCGCTAVRADDLTVPPGGRTAIQARLSLKGLKGALRKRLIVESNDPTMPLFTLVMEGEAVTGVDLRPERIALGAITLDSNDVHGIDILFRTNRPIRILHLDVTSPFFAARQEAPAPGFQHRVTVHAVPPFRPGPIQAALVILTDHPDFPRLEVPILGRAVADVYVTPEEIVLEAGAAGPEAARLLVVRSIRGQPFNVTRVEPPLPDMRVRTQPLRGGAHRIELRFHPDDTLDGHVLKIATDYPDVPELEVPFRVVHPVSPEADAAGGTPVPEEQP
jgi:hypothetical protein